MRLNVPNALTAVRIALIPACYMAFVKICDKVAGACISGEELRTSQQAIISVIAFVLAIGLLFLRRSRVRDAAFQLLVLFGQLWLVIKLIDSHERPETVMVVALIVIELAHEVIARIRAPRERAAELPAVPA